MAGVLVIGAIFDWNRFPPHHGNVHIIAKIILPWLVIIKNICEQSQFSFICNLKI